VSSATSLDEVLRVEGGRILAVLTRHLGDLDRAQDALQDAAVAAVEVWSRSGLPSDPGAWLYVAARRKAIDAGRREQRRHDKERDSLALGEQLARDLPVASVVRDDVLRLVFTCCHPALALDTRVALSLRTICGLSTAEVARVLLVSEATMAKRLTRAKAKIRQAGIAYRIPDAEDLPDRLAGVAAVVHLVYTAGHAGSGEALVRADLCAEAIRLARILAEQLPDEPTPQGLLALLLLTEARRPARLGPAGELVPLDRQDRRRWSAPALAEGRAWLERSLERSAGLADSYQLQAAIAACHGAARSYEATDWAEILRLYRLLAQLHPNPVVDVNLAVALGEVDGPGAALAALEAMPEAGRSYAWHAARGEALHRLGDAGAAEAALLRAAAGAPSEPEARHLRHLARRRAGPARASRPAAGVARSRTSSTAPRRSRDR
jgi:RNA polymerase sigma-70 factor (ECF subfamily)